MNTPAPDTRFAPRHILGIEGLSPVEITCLLDAADGFVALNRSRQKKSDSLRGLTLINLFFEDSTRTRTSFELAGKRLGADVINMSVATSSVHKGESLIDTAMTLNAMHPDVLVVRHPHSGAVQLLSQKVTCAVINAGDGSHEHPTQALLDALTIRRRKGTIGGLVVTICGDIAHSRVARSNIHLLITMGARVRLVGPPTLIPPMIEQAGIDRVWFGIFLVIVVEMAQITPPVGFNLFVLQGLTGRNILVIARAAIPFFLLLLVAVGLIVAFPEIVTYLPNRMTS